MPDQLVLPVDGNSDYLDRKPGDILLSPKGDGFIRRVQSVERKGKWIVVKTDAPEITDVFTQLEVAATVPLFTSDPPASGQSSQGMNSADGLGQRRDALQAPLSFSFNPPKIGTAELSIAPSRVTFKLAPTLDLALKISWARVQQFNSVLSVDFAAGADLTVAGKVKKTLSYDVGLLQLPPLRFPVPVPFTPLVLPGSVHVTVGLAGQVEVEGPVSMDIGGDVSAHVAVGARYINGAWQKVAEKSGRAALNGPTFRISSQAKVEGTVYVKAVVTIAELLAGSFGPAGYLGVKTEPSFQCNAHAGLRGKGGVKLTNPIGFLFKMPVELGAEFTFLDHPLVSRTFACLRPPPPDPDFVNPYGPRPTCAETAKRGKWAGFACQKDGDQACLNSGVVTPDCDFCCPVPKKKEPPKWAPTCVELAGEAALRPWKCQADAKGKNCVGAGDCVNCCCVPATCKDLGAQCGEPPDGCGGTLECPRCPDGTECAVNGVSYQCSACKPSATCESRGYDCGSFHDGCRVVTCGAGVCKAANEVCIDNVCTCKKKTCSEVGAQCGNPGDGCGGTLNCPKCPDDGVCGPNHLCEGGCTPKTCTALGAECGSPPDGCGGVIPSCGGCTGGETCDPTTFKCVGTCTPNDVCGNNNYKCGNHWNGCAQVSCGACAAPATCNSSYKCACIPSSPCSSKGYNCGMWFDGCNTVPCGTCSGFDTCGGSGQPNKCGCEPKSCTALDAKCGSPPDGCGGFIPSCGGCTGGEKCDPTTFKCVGTCTPNDVCGNNNYKCGNHWNGCAQVSCGACAAPATCNSSYKCACTPSSPCSSRGYNCGMSFDGCNTVSCGTCSGNEICGVGGFNRCGCRKKTCQEIGAKCGTPPDGCGGRLPSCGPCAFDENCDPTRWICVPHD